MLTLNERCHIDLSNQCICYDESYIHLSYMEVMLLQLLIKHADKILTKEEVIAELWPDDAQNHEYIDNLSQLIHRVRRILAICGLKNTILTVRNKGYRFSLIACQDIPMEKHEDAQSPPFPPRETLDNNSNKLIINILQQQYDIRFMCYLNIVLFITIISHYFSFLR